jgi:EmrB/QacA subfamily drug resistance transporter
MRANKEDQHGDGGNASVLFITTLSSFVTPLSITMVNIALPSMGRAFGFDAVTLSWVATAYLLSAAIFLVPFGKVSDIHGRKRVFVYGTWMFTVSSFFLGVSSSGGMLIVFRVLQGVGSAMVFATATAILISAFPVQKRGRVLGISVAAVYLGTTCGPFFGGLLTHHLGWRAIFFVNVPLGVTILVLSALKLKEESVKAEGERLDVPGSVVYGLTILAVMWGFSLLPAPGGAAVLAVGLIGAGAFVWLERRTERPVLDMRLFTGNKVFAFSSLAALINYSATFAVGFLLSFYFQHVKGLSPQSAGVLMMSGPIVQTIFSPVAGRLSDRVEPRVVVTTGMTVTATGLLMLGFVEQDTSVPFVVAILALLGLGFALFSSPNMNAIMSSVENRFYGVASATLGTMRLLGQVLSMCIATLIFTAYMGRVEIVPVHYPLLLKGIKTAFTVSGLLCLGGILPSLTRGNVR